MTIYRQISNSNVSNKYVFGITYFNWVANQDPIFEIIFLYKPNKVRQWPVRNYNRNHRVGSIDFHPQQLLSASIHSHHNSTLRHKNRYYWNLTKAIRIRIYKDRNFIIGYLCFFPIPNIFPYAKMIHSLAKIRHRHGPLLASRNCNQCIVFLRCHFYYQAL